MGSKYDRQCCKGNIFDVYCLEFDVYCLELLRVVLRMPKDVPKTWHLIMTSFCYLIERFISKGWYWDGIDDDGRLKSEVNWLENVLYPWAKRTRAMLEDYRRWKSASTASLVCLTIDTSIPSVYQKVLHYLRLADSSGMWPSTTAKRQLVMLSTSKDQSRITPLSVAHAATTSNRNSSSSAYSFQEGEGGASGSFSVGIMPDGGCSQPKGNLLFPELVRAAFELERALKPDRPPSVSVHIISLRDMPMLLHLVKKSSNGI